MKLVNRRVGESEKRREDKALTHKLIEDRQKIEGERVRRWGKDRSWAKRKYD